MPSLTTTRVVTTQEEPDTGEEAAVAAAIRVHEWVQTGLRRLAAGEEKADVSRPAAESNNGGGENDPGGRGLQRVKSEGRI
jgi:hypothetical protein